MRGLNTIIRRTAVALVAVSATCAIAWGFARIAADSAQEGAYRELAQQVTLDIAEEGIDWDALLAQNADACAWLDVEGTSVDTPVVAASADDPDKWLYSDLWGDYSDTGTPYLDYRCDADGRVMVVYGHRTLYANYLFHDLSGAFEQSAFDSLGSARWATEALGTTEFAPLCSASVDKSEDSWKRYAFAGAGEMREWLSWACSEASAVSADASDLVERASRVLVLVTCNGRPFYPDTRTVSVFVATEDSLTAAS